MRQIDIILNNKYNCNNNKIEVLTQLTSTIKNIGEFNNDSNNEMSTDEKTKNLEIDNKWIKTTKIACFWCCHQFNNTPWGIPRKYIDSKYQLFGIFCSPNCALAYLLSNNQNQSNEKLWEQVCLLNMLYFDVYGKYENLMPSPDKMALKMFGGTLDIDEFRNITCENDKSYTLEFPPCNTIIPVLEEIHRKSNLTN